MLPGKKYAPDDYLRMAWARRWFIVIPTIVIASGVFVYAHFLPDRYRSTATVLVIGQQVPEDLVRSTVTDSVAERLRAINSQILSRTKLERIIDEFHLYEDERKTRIMEDIIGEMRTRDLVINIPTPRRREDTSSFTVSFTAEKPKTAMLVAEELASLFVEENTQNRSSQAGITSQFFDASLEDARRRLNEQDAKIAEFRNQHAGRLPQQMQSNLQMLQTAQTQIQANVDAANKERDRLTQLEGLLADLDSARTAAAAAGESRPLPANAPVAQQLDVARAALRNMQLRLKDDHPDVKGAKRVVAELEVKAEAEALAMPLGRDTGSAAIARTPGEMQRLMDMRLQVQDLRASLERRKKDDERLRGVVASYSARLESTPGVEAEFADLMRDYSTLRDQFDALLKKREDSKLSESLERRQIGEQFRVIDTARLPERPVSPDRLKMNLMGILGGFAFGLGLVALLEYKDTTLKTDGDVVISLALPVLAVIPVMTNGVERAQHRRRIQLAAAAASVASVLLVAAAVMWKLRIIQNWIR